MSRNSFFSKIVVPVAVRPEAMQYLDSVLFAYREVPSASTHFSPFELCSDHAIREPMAIPRDAREEGIISTPTMDAVILERKRRVSGVPVLHSADVSCPSLLRTDAYDNGDSAVMHDFDGT
jgi:hypothetical protein